METLDPKVLWRGVELASQNAHTLMSVAQDAAARNAFGAAASLAILCAEEAAKAMGLATRALSHHPDPLHLKKYFRDHKHKHDAGAVFLGIVEFYSLLMAEMEALDLDQSVNEREKGALLLQRLPVLLEAELSGERKAFEGVNDWRKKAELIKKRGFYVDWVGESWSVPSEIDQDTFVAQSSRAELLLKLADAVVALGYEGAAAEYQKERRRS